MEFPNLRVALVDHHTLVREGIKALLHLRGGVLVALEVADGSEVAARLAADPCDVLLLDQRTWIAGDCDIREVRESTHVLLLADDADDPKDTLTALRHGARGVVFRSASMPVLLEALRTVGAGEEYMSSELRTYLAETMRERSQRTLTQREREIVRGVAAGLKNREVGRSLYISEQTVKTHLGSIFRKLGVRDRVGLALYAVRQGWSSAAASAR